MTPQERIAAEKKAALKAMLAGTPTKESEALRIKSNLYVNDKAISGQVNTKVLEEAVNRTPLRSATELTANELIAPDARGLPPTNPNDIELND